MKTTTVLIFLFVFLTTNTFSQWQPVGVGFATDAVGTLYVFNGKLYISGSYDINTNNDCSVDQWDGVSLTMVSPPIVGEVNFVTSYNNNLIALGHFRKFASTTITNGTAQWDGMNWFNLGNGLTDTGRILAGAEFQGKLYVGGSFQYVDSVYRRCIASWDGTQWSSVGTGLSSGLSDIQSMTVFDGELYIGGYFSSIDGTPALCIAKFNGTNWTQVGSGLNGDVKCLYIDSINNRLYACGNFNYSGTTNLPSNIAYWDGNNWNPVASNLQLTPYAVCIYKNDLYAGLGFNPVNSNGDTLNYIARWDGLDWQPLNLGLNSTVLDLIVYNDDLIVGGGFTSVDGMSINRLAIWHYSPNSIHDLTEKNSNLTIFPNPNENTITISCEKKFQEFSIINFNGQVVIQQQTNNKKEFTLNIATLSKGLYILKLKTDNRVVNKSFFKD